MRPTWFPNWSGECCAIIAAGPSVKKEHVSILENRIHAIAINESHKLAPWADMLYGCDDKWWDVRLGVKEFKGIKVAFKANFADVQKITIRKNGKKDYVNEILMDHMGEVGSGGNSGFQAVNLAAQFGATAIALIGFDYCVNGRDHHWHGPHPPPLFNPTGTNF